MLFSEIVSNLTDVYNSIDIRIVAFFHDSVWKTPFLIVRFRNETVEEVQKEQSELISKIGKIDNDLIRIRLYVFPTSQWENIRNDWSKNFISLEKDFGVNFIENNSLPNVDLVSPSYDTYDHLNTFWSGYNVNFRKPSSLLAKLGDFHEEARKITFKNIYEYIAVALQVDRESVDSGNLFMYITAPIFFKIKDSGIIFDTNKILISGKNLPLGTLNVALDLYNNRRGSYTGSWKDRIKGDLKLEANHNEPKDFEFELKIPSLTVNDGFKIIVQRESGLLLYEKSITDVSYYWPSKSTKTNPIFPIFLNFVTSDELTKILFEGRSKKGNTSSINFEKGISWLLGLLGFNPIWLGDEFQMTGEGTERTSIDILGHVDRNTILLVNPTMGIPDSSAFAREKRYRENVLQKLTHSEIQIISVIITNASVQSLKDKAKQNDVILIGKEELQTILDNLSKGNVSKARGLFLEYF